MTELNTRSLCWQNVKASINTGIPSDVGCAISSNAFRGSIWKEGNGSLCLYNPFLRMLRETGMGRLFLNCTMSFELSFALLSKEGFPSVLFTPLVLSCFNVVVFFSGSRQMLLHSIWSKQLRALMEFGIPLIAYNRLAEMMMMSRIIERSISQNTEIVSNRSNVRNAMETVSTQYMLNTTALPNRRRDTVHEE